MLSKNKGCNFIYLHTVILSTSTILFIHIRHHIFNELRSVIFDGGFFSLSSLGATPDVYNSKYAHLKQTL